VSDMPSTLDTAPTVPRRLGDRLLRAASLLTTPLLPDDYLSYVDPLFSTREPRGRVVAVLPETADSATLWLQTRDFPAHVPGQYIRVGVEIDGVRHWRTYSLTTPAARADRRIAITVKAMPDGFVSQHLVHATRPGTIVRLAPPAGEFVLPAHGAGAVLFVTAGSGITPVMSMLRALAAGDALDDVVHVHLAPSANDVIFGAELRRLAAQHDGYTLHEHHDDASGLFDAAALDALCPDWRERAAWACGPAGLLDALTARYEEAGVPEALNLERFRPVIPSAAAGAATGGRITFRASGKTVDADGVTPLLVAGESAGALLRNGCRMGICHTCVGALCSGSVVDLRTGEMTTADPAQPDLIRICVSAASGDVEIDL